MHTPWRPAKNIRALRKKQDEKIEENPLCWSIRWSLSWPLKRQMRCRCSWSCVHH